MCDIEQVIVPLVAAFTGSDFSVQVITSLQYKLPNDANKKNDIFKSVK